MIRKALLATSIGVAIFAGEIPGAEAAMMVQITAPQEGATVTGIFMVSATADPAVTSVAFEWSTTEGATWLLIGTDSTGPSWTVAWDTRSHTGPALLRAVATDGVTSASDTNSLIVDNLPPVFGLDVSAPAFSPDGDNQKDTTTFMLTSNEPALVTVRLLDSSGAERRRWSEDLTAPGTAALDWDGRVDGVVLPDATYTVEATAADHVGLSTQRIANVIIDTVAPVASWMRISPEPASALRPLTFRFRSSDRAADLRASIEVLDRVGRVARREEAVTTGNREIRWRPRYRGRRSLLPGLYRARLTVTDDAGNVSHRDEIRWRVARTVHARVFRRLAGAGRRVAITIDDCHYPDAWSRMLTILRTHKVKATFFCPGDRMVLFPHLTRRTEREGHLLAAHGWDHSALPGQGAWETSRQLRDTAEVAWKLARETTAPYFRPPYGACDEAVTVGAGATGHSRVIMWDVTAQDTSRPGAGAIARNAVGPARPGSIILLHTISQTADALPSIITGLRRKGLQPVTLAELFRAAGYQ
jgi:peptidoglycan/xylan/chitin deacetylase (PgdA/CDA1 family)